MQTSPAVAPVNPIIESTPAESVQATGITEQTNPFSQHLEKARNKQGLEEQPLLGKETLTEKNNSETSVWPDGELEDAATEFSFLIAAHAPVSIPPDFNGQPAQASTPIALTTKDSVAKQVVEMLNMQQSVQISNPIGQQNEKEQLVPSFNRQQAQVEATISGAFQRQATTSLAVEIGEKNSEQTDLIIENWRTQFSYKGTSSTPVTTPQQVATQKIAEMKGQEPVVTYMSPALQEITPHTQGKSSSSLELHGQRQDANSNFIHSNLPGISAAGNDQGKNSAQQQNGGGENTMAKQENIVPSEQSTSAQLSQETPLIFSLDQETTSGLPAQSPSTTTPLTLRLPSGTEVPHNAIMNQVIDRFTLNRTLKSGSITLRLHPAELGELKMEIKVEQDNIKAHITTQNPQVQEILDRQLPRLREALEQQGLHLEHMDVTVAADDGQNSQLFQEHFNRQQSSHPTGSRLHAPFTLKPDDGEEDSASGGQQNLNVLV